MASPFQWVLGRLLMTNPWETMGQDQHFSLMNNDESNNKLFTNKWIVVNTCYLVMVVEAMHFQKVKILKSRDIVIVY